PAELSMLVFRARLGLRRLAPSAPGAPARRGGGAEVVMPGAIAELGPGAAAGAIAASGAVGHEQHGIK
ncbi:MAG: hypothetical protein ACRDLF_11190, partial [Solirubrobacteraceae bacterium]